MKAPFDTFFAQLRETNATLDYFVNFDKVRENVATIAIKLNQLNYLIGQKDLRTAIAALYAENPAAFTVLDILIAVRQQKKTKVLNSSGAVVPLDSHFTSPEGIYTYLTATGLAEVFQNKDIRNLVDYVFGIEVGLDSNARKNRSGDNMSIAIAQILIANTIPYETEVSIIQFPHIIGWGKDIKRFDFVIQTTRKTYLIEANFYNSSGSKPNEVSRAYKELAAKINSYPDYEFIWITDGQGWQSAKNKLEEAYNSIPGVYNLTTLPAFIDQLKTELP
jgi:type-2 restriction enzyme mboI